MTVFRPHISIKRAHKGTGCAIKEPKVFPPLGTQTRCANKFNGSFSSLRIYGTSRISQPSYFFIVNTLQEESFRGGAKRELKVIGGRRQKDFLPRLLFMCHWLPDVNFKAPSIWHRKDAMSFSPNRQSEWFFLMLVYWIRRDDGNLDLICRRTKRMLSNHFNLVPTSSGV